MWFSFDRNTAFHTAREWHSQTSGNLFFVSSKKADGEDGYGQYSSTVLSWSINTASETDFTTEARLYPKENIVIFESKIAREGGITNTNCSGAIPILNFPTVLTGQGRLPRLGYAYYHGLWPQPVVSKNLTALQRLPNRYEGPVLFTDVDGTSVLFGPLNDPLNTVFNIVNSAGGKQGHAKTLAFGPSSMLSSLPYRYRYSVVLVVGDGATETVGRYGPLLNGKELQYRSYHFSRSRLADPFVDKISAWTDNGAYYFYAGEQTKTMSPAQSTLPQWLSNPFDLRSCGEFFAAGWLVDEPDYICSKCKYISGLGNISQKSWGKNKYIIVQSLFSGQYDLFEKYKKVQSPKGVWYPSGEDAYGFYGDLLDAFKKLGGTNFETDFMSDHLLPT